MGLTPEHPPCLAFHDAIRRRLPGSALCQVRLYCLGLVAGARLLRERSSPWRVTGLWPSQSGRHSLPRIESSGSKTVGGAGMLGFGREGLPPLPSKVAGPNGLSGLTLILRRVLRRPFARGENRITSTHDSFACSSRPLHSSSMMEKSKLSTVTSVTTRTCPETFPTRSSRSVEPPTRTNQN